MQHPLPPDGLGRLGQRHEVNVYVFRVSERGIEYLLLRPKPELESLWRPVVHPVGLDEDLHCAALRGVRVETGLDHAYDLVGAEYARVQNVGDLQLVGWPFGFQLRDPQADVRRRGRFAATAWCRFEEAIQTVGSEGYRQNLLQLHWKLVA